MASRQVDRLTFLVQFVQMDLNTLRPGDWLNLRDDLCRYMNQPSSNTWYINRDDPLWTTTPCAVIAAIQSTTATVLDLRVDGNAEARDAAEALQRYYPDESQTVETLSYTRERNAFTIGPQDVNLLTKHHEASGSISSITRYYTDAHSAFFQAVMLHLSSEPTDAVRRCPECHTLFVRVRKQVYCSRTCVNRVAVRKFRATDEGKQTEGTRARARYEQKVKGTTNVKVGRHQKRRTPKPQAQGD